MFSNGQKLKIKKQTQYKCCPGSLREGDIIVVKYLKRKRDNVYMFSKIGGVGWHTAKLTSSNAYLVD